MVKKLIKHEIKAMGRLLVPMYIILLGLALITRIIVFFETDSVIYSIISGSAIVVLCIGLLAGTLYTEVSCIIRFYKNLFSKEGYLTFTLPVSIEAHLWTKLLVASVASVASLGVIFGAFCIAASGELLVEIFKAAGYLLNQAYMALGADLVLYIIEFVAIMLVSILATYLLLYACMCIGQLAKRSRVLLALGVYFGYYYITQIIVTVFMVIFSMVSDSEFMLNIYEWIYDNPIATSHIVLLSSLVSGIVMGGIYYLIAKSIMKKKLNLE